MMNLYNRWVDYYSPGGLRRWVLGFNFLVAWLVAMGVYNLLTS